MGSLLAGAQPAKRVFVAPDAHTDYLWTAGEETYRRAHLERIDYYLDQADRTAGTAADHQVRWNCDGSLWLYGVTGIFGTGWDRLKTMDDEVVTAAKKRTTAERWVIVSNEEDYFRDFEATHGRDLPRFSAAFGNEWDLYIASVAELSALATLVSMRRPKFMKGRESARG
jgi:hypothetical protein